MLLRPTGTELMVPSPPSTRISSSPNSPTITRQTIATAVRTPLQKQDTNVISGTRRRPLSSLVGGIGLNNIGFGHSRTQSDAAAGAGQAGQQPRVHGMVAKLNAMDGPTLSSAASDDGVGGGGAAPAASRQTAALKRAELARDMTEHEIIKVKRERDEAEADLHRTREEIRKTKVELEDTRDRERKSMKRADVLSNELSRSKDTHASAVSMYEKEVRKCRKEGFRASSTVVKLQAELQSVKASLRAAQVLVESEKRRANRRDEDAFAAEYQLVGLQEGLAEAVERFRLVEAERDFLRSAEDARQTARLPSPSPIVSQPPPQQQQLTVTVNGATDIPDVGEPRTPMPDSGLLFGSPTKLTFDLSSRSQSQTRTQQHIRQLEQQLADEKEAREGAERKSRLMRLECQFGCCTCRLVEMAGGCGGGKAELPESNPVDASRVRSMLFGDVQEEGGDIGPDFGPDTDPDDDGDDDMTDAAPLASPPLLYNGSKNHTHTITPLADHSFSQLSPVKIGPAPTSRPGPSFGGMNMPVFWPKPQQHLAVSPSGWALRSRDRSDETDEEMEAEVEADVDAENTPPLFNRRPPTATTTTTTRTRTVPINFNSPQKSQPIINATLAGSLTSSVSSTASSAVAAGLAGSGGAADISGISAMRPDGSIDKEAARELIRRRRGRSAASSVSGLSAAGGGGSVNGGAGPRPSNASSMASTSVASVATTGGGTIKRGRRW